MDFLARQTGVPRLDVKHLDILPAVLERIPRRLAEQMTILPVAFKEPKSLVVAMADPSDLNAVDSARFASGLNIEPMVASHSALRMAIADNYRKLESGSIGVTVDVNWAPQDESLPVNFEMPPMPVPQPKLSREDFARDPFFEGLQYKPPEPPAPSPFQFFSEPPEAPRTAAPKPAAPRPPEPKPTDSQGMIIHTRSAAIEQVRGLETFQTRALVFGLVKILQRRGILGADELQRFVMQLIETGEISER